MNKTRWIVTTMFSLGLIACGKSENPPEDALKVKQVGDQVTYETSGNDGQKVTITAGEKGVDLPADFPKDVPIIKAGVVRASMSEGNQLIVQISWKGGINEAIKFYESEMKSHQWTIESRFSTTDMSMISAKKKGRQATVTVSPDENDQVVIQIILVQDQDE